jgi:hypothetical protein
VAFIVRPDEPMLQSLKEEVEDFAQSREAAKNKAVSQESMAGGDIELF